MKGIKVVLKVLIVTTLILLSSCDMRDNMLNDRSQNTAPNNSLQVDALADEIYSGLSASVGSELMMVSLNDFQNLDLKSANHDFTCRVVSIDHPDSTYFPKIITIDYGAGCSVIFGNDTLTRSGKIVMTSTNKFNIKGAQQIIVFDKYIENGIEIDGTFKMNYLGADSAGNLVLDDSLIGGKLVINDTATYTRNSVTTFEWYRAPDPYNDTIYMSGSASGINSKGENYSSIIVKKLKLVRCTELWNQWVIIDGEVTNTVNGVESTINYTSTNCTNYAETNQKGKVHHFRIWHH